MPKSKHRRKGDKRPVRRSGKNEGPTDYRTARPVREYSDEKIPEIKSADRVFSNAFN